MKKLLMTAALASMLGAAYMPAAHAARPSDVAAGALVGGVLGYAMGHSNSTYYYQQPYYGYGYAYNSPDSGWGAAPNYNWSNYQGERPSCAGLPGSRPAVDQWGRYVGVMCPNGMIQYYRY